MFLIMFKSRHALPLPGGRFLSPRNGRGERAKEPRINMDLWPQTRRFRDQEQSRYRARTKNVRVHEQSVTTLNPRQRAGQLTVRIRVLGSTSTVRKQASARGTEYPQTVRSLELFRSTTSSLTGIVHEPRSAENHLCRRIVVSMSAPTSFQVHIQTIPAYVLI